MYDFRRVEELPDSPIKARLTRFNALAIDALECVRLGYGYSTPPVELRYSDSTDVYAEGASYFGAQIRINLTVGVLLGPEAIINKSGLPCEYSSHVDGRLPPPLCAFFSGLWVLLHEYFHIARRHTGSEDPERAQAVELVGEKAFILATEYDADLMATASLLSLIRSKFKPPAPLSLVEYKKLVLCAIHPVFAAARINEIRPPESHFEADARLVFCIIKLGVCGQSESKEGVPTINTARANKDFDALVEQMMAQESIICRAFPQDPFRLKHGALKISKSNTASSEIDKGLKGWDTIVSNLVDEVREKRSPPSLLLDIENVTKPDSRQ